MRTYLAGAMDRVSDGGVGWRRKITPHLQKMDIIVLDPSNKPIDIGIEDDAHRQERRRRKLMGDYEQLAKEMKLLRVIDLRMVDNSDFLIVNLDTDVHACGTYEEIFWANRMKMPILIRCEQGKKGVPDWLFGVIPHEHMFDTWEDMLAYLAHVDSAPTVDHMKRWVFLDYKKLLCTTT